jgi:hypothetical protein
LEQAQKTDFPLKAQNAFAKAKPLKKHQFSQDLFDNPVG